MPAEMTRADILQAFYQSQRRVNELLLQEPTPVLEAALQSEMYYQRVGLRPLLLEAPLAESREAD